MAAVTVRVANALLVRSVVGVLVARVLVIVVQMVVTARFGVGGTASAWLAAAQRRRPRVGVAVCFSLELRASCAAR